MTAKPTPSREENYVFRALYLLAIVFVVDGHTTLSDMFDLGGLFRYYSFHLMLFAFGAGYFFRLHGGAAEDLLAPMWSRRKREVLNAIDKRLAALDTWQGKKYQQSV